ncbi:hypothetical protein [Streptomyces boncukensis]|uniref:Low molecular weight antigen MTB12-like C-terminal domain-containing protein n=1 Tax=Streptomyces boncukensis TaxID=2711219 RepID=A0A6G4WT44_9ACTN|nr:hypothetical protein [Streptomyces boncukensis]NGO68173.1 hypothetical protein [Streptomyces boncukensis]
MGRGGSAAALAALLVLGAGAAGCGDDSEDRATEPKPPPATSDESPGDGGDDGSGDGGDGGDAAPQDRARAEKEVRRNWERFFDPKVPNDDKAKYLENGEQLKLLLEAFNEDERGRQVQAEVTKVTFTSDTAADVDYALLLKSATALPNAKGAAVEQGDTWKVSVRTLCALVKMSGTEVPKAPGC